MEVGGAEEGRTTRRGKMGKEGEVYETVGINKNKAQESQCTLLVKCP